MEDYLSRQLSAATTGTGGALDWLNEIIGGVSDVALTGYKTYAEIEAARVAAKQATATQQAYQNSQQSAITAFGATNLIKGVDNNVLLIGGVVLVVGLFAWKG